MGAVLVVPASARSVRDRRPLRAGSDPAPNGDFNGDGFADVAIGDPGETVGSVSHAGAVNVLYGSAGGVATTGNQFWNQGSPNVPDTAETGDAFGFAVAAGDFNADGFGDLAVGVPDEDLGGHADAGMVQVLVGSQRGLTVGPWFWESSPGMPTNAAAGDGFGWAVAAGDLNGDGRADLAVGLPGRSVSGRALAGATIVLYGSPTGLTSSRSQVWTQNVSGVPGTANKGDRLGFSLAIGDFNADGSGDLAAGVPGEDVGTGADAGAAQILYGSVTGLVATGGEVWYQDSPGVLGRSEMQDDFGYALAAGDLDGDGADDLAVGAPFEDEGGALDAGAVNVLYGSRGGLTATGNQLWALDSPSIPGGLQASASFGFVLSSGNYDGDGFADLAIGDPGHAVSGRARAGAVNVLYGSPGGLAAARAQFWNQDSPGLVGHAEAGDEFGFALGAGEAGNGGQEDLFVGVPFEDTGSIVDAGDVNVLYGSSTGLTSAANEEWDQNVSGVADSAERADQFGAAVASGTSGGPPP